MFTAPDPSGLGTDYVFSAIESLLAKVCLSLFVTHKVNEIRSDENCVISNLLFLIPLDVLPSVGPGKACAQTLLKG